MKTFQLVKLKHKNSIKLTKETTLKFQSLVYISYINGFQHINIYHFQILTI